MTRGHGSVAEWDLDADPGLPAARRTLPGLALVTALVLAGLFAGAAGRAVAAPAPGTADDEVSARIELVDVRLRGPSATLRLTAGNPGPAPVRLAALVVEGLESGTAGAPPSRITVRLGRVLPAGGETTVDLTVRPQCGRLPQQTPLRARLLVPGRPGGTPVLPTRGLGPAGGLCRQFSSQLPAGWNDPVTALSAQVVEGGDLQVELSGLGGEVEIAGIWVDDRVLRTRSEPIRSGPDRQVVRVVHPGGCLAGTRAVATGLRVVTLGDGGFRERLMPLGPGLAGWLLRDC